MVGRAPLSAFDRCTLPTHSAVTHQKGIRGTPPAHQPQKTIISAGEARKVAQLSGHHLDRLRGLAFVVRDDKTRCMATPNEIASESKKA